MNAFESDEEDGEGSEGERNHEEKQFGFDQNEFSEYKYEDTKDAHQAFPGVNASENLDSEEARRRRAQEEEEEDMD